LNSAHVSRTVNYLYFLVVLIITFTVLGIAIFTKNKRAIKMFLFAMAIWSLIELIGLVSGMRVYEPSGDRILIFLFVALVEDPGWICLCYMAAEFLYNKIVKKQSDNIRNNKSNLTT
jgi:hypothetical protein